MYPVYVKTPGTIVSGDDTCYIVAREGIMLRKQTFWVRATVPVQSIGVLDSEPPEAEVLLPDISADVFAKAITFFRAVYKKHKSEAIVLLHYSPEKEWCITVPKQEVSQYRIHKYDMAERLEGYECVGTIHSHSDLSAGHSSVDHDDEAQFDGIHITFGHCNSLEYVSVSSEVAINGCRFTYDLGEPEGFTQVEKIPGAWFAPHVRSGESPVTFWEFDGEGRSDLLKDEVLAQVTCRPRWGHSRRPVVPKVIADSDTDVKGSTVSVVEDKSTLVDRLFSRPKPEPVEEGGDT